MPSKNRIKTVSLPGFAGGLNLDADPYQLEANETPDCLNVDLGFRGAVSKRAGYSNVTTTQVGVNERLVSWAKQGGSEYLIAVQADGDVWDYTSTPAVADTSWVAASGVNDYPIGVAALNNKLYLTHLRATGGPLSFDGSTWAALTATTFDGTASTFPKARFLVSAHSRIFAANVIDGGTAQRSRLHWSDVLDAETWSANSYIDFDPDDGQQITALASFGEELVVFKDHSVQLLAGKSKESFSRFVVDSQLGTVSPYAVAPMGAVLVFFDRDTGVWAFDGSGFELISEKINSALLEGINYSEAHKAHMFVRHTKLYMSVPWGADTYNSRMFVWDQRTKAWSQYDFGVADATAVDDTTYGVGARNTVGVQKLFDTLNDAGAAIDSYVFTPWISPDGPEAKSRIRRLDLAFSAKGDFDVDVSMYRNFTLDVYRAQTINTDPGGSKYGTAVYGVDRYGTGVAQTLKLTSGWGQRFRAVQFRFGVAAVDDDFQLNKVTMHISSLGRVRGEA